MLSPYQDFKYEIGKEYSVKKYNTDETELCGEGLNVATLEWCLRNSMKDLDMVYIEVEFESKDIVAIPFFTDGKFRVRKFKVIRKVPIKELQAIVGKGR